MPNELDGVKELTRKLHKLDSALFVKNMRSVLFRATTPVVRQMRSRIPIGTEMHRTYRGRLVTPGFAKRSLKRVTGKKYLNRGRLSIAIGLKKEAWYSILYDQGPYTISTRRQSTNYKAKGHVGMQRRHISIRPYTLKRRPWFESTFIAGRSQMLTSIKSNLKSQIDRIAKNG